MFHHATEPVELGAGLIFGLLQKVFSLLLGLRLRLGQDALALGLQFLLALGRRSFLLLLAVGAVAVPLVVALRDSSLESVAIGLLILDALLAALMLALSIGARGPGKHGLTEGEAENFALAESSAAAEAAIP